MDRYLSAAWKISAQAVASPAITPSLETFRVRGDLSQHDHVPGLPIGTRGGILIRHYFPVDGEYVISPRLYRETVNIIRGLELEHDLEVTPRRAACRARALRRRRRTNRPTTCNPTLAGDEMEKRFQKRLQVTAGPHDVGVAFIKKSSATTLELLQPFERERIDPITPVGIPELDRVTVEGPFNSGDRASRRRAASASSPARPASDREARSVRADDPVDGRTPRLSRPGQRDGDRRACSGFYEKERAQGGTFDRRHRRRADLPAGQSAVPVSSRAGSRQCRARHRVSRQRPRAGVAPLVLPLEQHSGRRAAEPGRSPAGCANPAVLEQQVRRMLKDERARALGSNFAGTVAVPAQPARPAAGRRRLPGLRPQPARGDAARNGDALRERRARGQERAASCSTPTTPS